MENKFRILSVDDDETNQILVREILKDDFIVEMAMNGLEAIKKIKSKKYDLILMDIKMPKLNGFETTFHIRKKMSINTPIIALTSLNTQYKKDSEYLGMNGFIAKPYFIDDLLTIVNKTLNLITA